MLEMPRSLMSTSGWFFSRLSSTNFFRDLDMTWTKPQQSTWATARRVQGEKGGSPRLALSSFPQVLGSGQRRAGSGNKDGGRGARGREMGRVQHHSRRGEANTTATTHTHSLRRAAPNRHKLQTSAGLTPVAGERCARSV